MKGLMASGWQKGCRNPQEIDKLLEFCRDTKVTDLFFHVFVRGTALYISDFVPKYDFGGLAADGGRKHSTDFDSLQYVLDHAGDIKIHAYLTMLEFGRGELGAYSPSWFMKNGAGVASFDPIFEEVRTYLTSVCREVATKYPTLSGMYLEKLRYPTRATGKGGEEEKRAAILNLIESISREVKRANPNLMLSYCSNLNRNCKENVQFYELVDWDDLLTRGIIDKFIPTLFRTVIDENDEPRKDAEFNSWLDSLDPLTTVPVIGACDLKLDKTKARIKECTDRGFGYIIYSYGYFSSHGEKRTDFKAKLCQPST